MHRGEITNGDHVRLLPDPALFHPSMFNGVFTVVTAVPVLLNAFYAAVLAEWRRMPHRTSRSGLPSTPT